MDPYAYRPAAISPELAEKHLHRLVQTVHISPEKTTDLRQSIEDYVAAMEQLDMYFPLYDAATKAVDWWLRPGTPASPRMRTVKALAPSVELVDWIAKWAYNVF